MKIRKHSKAVSVKGMISLMLAIATVVIVRNGYAGNSNWYWLLLAVVPVLIIILASPLKKSYRRNTRVRRHYSSLN